MARPTFTHFESNPVLTRELRLVLRNVRTFMLLAVYVAVLGAIVLAQFPSDATLTVPELTGADSGPASGQSAAVRGSGLFRTFLLAQLVLVATLVPVLSTGALAQERERHTLQPLLLTPLTPLQIVWGKAAGVLALTLLLLLSTLPLTSLCFLLGGVSTGELVGGYAVLLALALFFTGVGLYAAAHWTSSVQATIWCYVLLAVSLPLLALAGFIGSTVSGLVVIGAALGYLFKRWGQWAQHPRARRLGWVWWLILIVLLAIGFGYFSTLVLNNRSLGAFMLYVIFLAPALVFVALFPLRYAAEELARRPPATPRVPTREWMSEMHAEWQRAVSPPPVVYLPSPTGQYTYTPLTPDPPVPLRRSAPTYGKVPFLSDKLNPILAKDLRNGIAGKAETIFRFSYVVTIGTELLLLFYLLFGTATSYGFSTTRELQAFVAWGKLHLLMLMLAGAWLGARALAPEREQQTLPQLLATPLPAATIIGGKMQAVMAYTFYVFVLGVPLALILPLLGLLSWTTALMFLVVELVLGAFAAAWGIFCSQHFLTTRRALGWSVGAILCLWLLAPLLGDAVAGGLSLVMGVTGSLWTQNIGAFVRDAISPLRVLESALFRFDAPSGYVPVNATLAAGPTGGATEVLSLFCYAALTVLLLFLTASGFKRYVQSL